MKYRYLNLLFIVGILGFFLTACYQPSSNTTDSSPTPPRSNLPDESRSNSNNELIAEINKVAAKITVRIDSRNSGSGSGVIVAKRENTYYVLTAAHVVENQDEYTVVTPDGQQHQVEEPTILKDVDLALVKFSSNRSYSVASLGNYNIGRAEFQLVFLSGFPASVNHKSNGHKSERELSAGITFTQGLGNFLVKDASSLVEGYEMVYTNISQRGMSGGPVLDKSGRVIGIHTAAEGERVIEQSGEYAEIYLGLSLGVPVSTFISLASRGGINYQWLRVEPSAPAPLTELEIGSLGERLLAVESPSRWANEAAWLNYGNQLWRVLEFEEAVTAFEQAIKRKSDFYQAYYAKGLALRDQEKWDEARIAFAEAINLKSDFSEAWREQGKALWRLGRKQEALESIDRAIELKDNDSTLYTLRGSLLLESEKYSEARDYFDKALQIKPNFLLYTLRGFAYFRLEDISKARADFTRVIQIQPENALAYLGRAIVTLELSGDIQGAKADLEKAIEFNPDLAEAYFYRGSIRLSSGENEPAMEDFNQAIKLNNRYAKAYVLRGWAGIYSNNYRGAIADFNQALKIDSNLPGAYAGRGLVRAVLEEYQEARNNCEQAIEFQSNLPEAYLCLGFVFHKQKDYPNAIEKYNQALESEDFVLAIIATTNLGLIEYELGNKDKAVSYWQEVLEVNQAIAEPILAIAVTLYTEGEEEKGLTIAREAFNLDNQLRDLEYLRENLWGERLLEDTKKILSDNRLTE